MSSKARNESSQRYKSSPKGKRRAAEWEKANPERKVFAQAKDRCRNIRHPRWKDYGGRGIRFKFKSFDEFLAEVGKRPNSSYSLDRPNPWGHYEKGNVFWATRAQQDLHKRGVIEELRSIGPKGIIKLLSFIPRKPRG